MTYRRFKLPETHQTVATVATVARGSAEMRKSNGIPLARARDIHTAKFNNNNNININALHTYEAVSFCKGGAASPAPVFAYDTATVATLRHFAPAPDYRAALAVFKEARPYGVTRFHHDQAYWAAEMFLGEWSGPVIEFEWTAEDMFAPPRINGSGLAYWLGCEIVTALGPVHAVTEGNRVFDRITRATWINPYPSQERVH